MADQVTVRGRLDGVPFTVALTGDRDRPVAGSDRVLALVLSQLGRSVLLSPSGPRVQVAADDPASIVAAMNGDPGCVVRQVTGLDGALLGPRRHGAVN